RSGIRAPTKKATGNHLPESSATWPSWARIPAPIMTPVPRATVSIHNDLISHFSKTSSFFIQLTFKLRHGPVFLSFFCFYYAIFPDIVDQPLHFHDFSTLRFDDLIREFSDSYIFDLRPLTGQNSDGVMGDHTFHVIYTRDGFLTSDQPYTARNKDNT